MDVASQGGSGCALPLDLFDYALPQDAIAHVPVEPRDSSRLMHLPAVASRDIEHRVFRDLPSLLGHGDLLVINRTRVIPARLRVTRPTGGRVELLLVRPLDGPFAQARVWEAMGRPGSALRVGAELVAPEGVRLRVVARRGMAIEVCGDDALAGLLEQHGEVPLPPYIARPQGPTRADVDAYQSIFAREAGAVAAPTASLHFTDSLVAALRERGVRFADVVLHVGPGTFLPVRKEHAADVRQHEMHEERYDVPEATQTALHETRAAGGRVIAVGTTSVRALESYATNGEASGATRIFVYPGHTFRYIDGLVTNFHLPRSTLLLLVAAMVGRERVLDAYRVAIERGYRFFSYGDAMLLWTAQAARARA